VTSSRRFPTAPPTPTNILRDADDVAIAAIEWENRGLHEGDTAINEFDKLNQRCHENPAVRFAGLVVFRVTGPSPGHDEKAKNATKTLESYTKRWTASSPLLLVAVEYEWIGFRKFTQITIDSVQAGKKTRLRKQVAYPWDVSGWRWAGPRRVTSP
jgi:hypothetical protein